MAKSKGVHAKLGRGTRKPKVHITYDSAAEGMEKVELPFVVGVMSDLSNKELVDEEGDPIPVRNRQFKEVDRDNFGDYMKKLEPEATVRVDNELSKEKGSLSAKLKFTKMDDFRPENVAEQVPALKELLDMRKQLSDLKGKLDGNDKLERLVKEIIAKTADATGGGSKEG